jgi:large-conductance mechanosensitive channel
MRYIGIFFVVVLLLSGCGNEKENRKIKLMNSATLQTGVNPNSLAYVAKDKEKDRQNRVELSKIEAKTKIELEKIRSQNELHIAKLNAQTQKDIAQNESATKIKTSQLEVDMKREGMHYGIYIVIAIIILIMIALLLLYLNAKKNRELKKRLHEEKLLHEQFLKEKELEEQRLHKILDLVAAGKMPQTIEEEVILSISKPQTKVIK